jgi:hypothetical protein
MIWVTRGEHPPAGWAEYTFRGMAAGSALLMTTVVLTLVPGCVAWLFRGGLMVILQRPPGWRRSG